MPFENPNDDPKVPNSAAEQARHAGLEAPDGLPQEVPGTQHFDNTSLDKAATEQGWVANGSENGDIVSSDVPPAIPSHLGESAAPATEEEIAAARRDVESRNKKKPLWVKIGAGVTALAAAGALYIGIKPSNKAPEQTGSGTETSAPATPSTINPETANPTPIEQGATSVTITTPSAEVTTSAPVVGELSPSVLEQVAGNKAVTRDILEKQFGQSFAPESILAAANTIDLNNIDKNPSVFSIQEIPYTDGMTVEDATSVYNSYVANESTRIVNLLIQSRNLESTVAVKQPFSGVAPEKFYSVQDLILMDAKGKFALDGVSEAVLINGVPGTPDGILQHLKDIADNDKLTQYDRVVVMGIPEPNNRTPDSPNITGVTPLEGADARGLSGVAIQTGNLIYKSAQYLVTEDYNTSGNFTVAPGISGKLLQGDEKLALYKDKGGNLVVELTGYEAHTN